MFKFSSDIKLFAVLKLRTNDFYADEIAQIKSAEFIIVHDVCDKNSVKILNEIVGLDIGESEAISLAITSSADVLLIDEHKGRQDIFDCIDTLRNSSVRISEKLFNLMLNHINCSM